MRDNTANSFAPEITEDEAHEPPLGDLLDELVKLVDEDPDTVRTAHPGALDMIARIAKRSNRLAEIAADSEMGSWEDGHLAGWNEREARAKTELANAQFDADLARGQGRAEGHKAGYLAGLVEGFHLGHGYTGRELVSDESKVF